MTHFAFLQREWPQVYDAARRAEQFALGDPRTACFHARRALEVAIRWAFKHDQALRLPYQENISALIHEPTFKAVAGETIFTKARLINSLGNRAVHNERTVPPDDAVTSVRELFHVCYWLARTYARGERPASDVTFDDAALPKPGDAARKSAEQLQKLQEEVRARDEKLEEVLAHRASLDAELQALRAEVARAREAAAATPDTHDYSESETRDRFIDLLLEEAGWTLDDARCLEFEVSGMPNQDGKGFVDYVLWGDDGKPVGLVEAKRTRRDPRVGQQQAKLYADCLEQQFGQRPVIFYSNGYEHWIWDDAMYPPRAVQGFYTRDQLELLIRRRTIRRSLLTADIDSGIVERFYQTRAIRRVAEAFERDHDRKALLVMATGAGKTRTVIAMTELLMRCNWAKRVLFLADRVALVNQAVNAFKTHLSDAPPVNLVTERDGEGRVFVSTYPTMMGLIDERRDSQRRFGPGYFDLIVIDEAHRSVFQKYRAIFQHFDALLVGLTATPKDEVARNTYSLFELEDGVPTDAYSLDEAVADGFLVPPIAVSVPLKFHREGIKYDELSDEDKDEWDALEWDEDGNVPDAVDAAAVNKWLFNKDTVDKVLAHLMTRGLKVAGGDRLGKTIVFAKNQDHAEFIAERFNASNAALAGHFARVITFKTEYTQSLIDDFSKKDSAPHIAISVDMLDTGIDVPEVVNLVFFKIVRSKTKFWQMVGRGTRLCPDLFGPGQHKSAFYIFDYCQNLEYFGEDPPGAEGSVAPSISSRLFARRLELLAAIDGRNAPPEGGWLRARERAPAFGDPRTETELRWALSETLLAHVKGLNPDQNFLARPYRRTIERFAKPEAWDSLSREAITELGRELASLATAQETEPEEARRFDLLLTHLQVAVLRGDASVERLSGQVRQIASLLEDQSTIPAIRAHLPLIQDLQSDEYWQDVTVPMLEVVRRRLRGIVVLIEKKRRKPLFTDFADVMGPETVLALPGAGAGTDYERFRAKARAFLREHEDHLAVQKLRTNRQLTASDLAELERMLVENGVGRAEELDRAKAESHGLGLFVRSLVGLDREAAKAALSSFQSGRTFSASQLEFVNLIVDHLTEHGTMEAARLYESPFSDITAQGPESLFDEPELDQLLSILSDIRRRAEAA